MSIEALLSPKSVAVVGASPDIHKPSGMVLNFLERGGYGGMVYPVNPRYEAIKDWRCYSSISALPAPPDLVVVATPAEHALGVIEESAKAGAPAALVMTGGFGEGGTGQVGADRRDQLNAIIAGHRIRVLGPNTVGLVNFTGAVPLTFADWYGRDLGLRDKVAVLTHSGSTGGLIFSMLQGAGIGVNYWVGLGNEIDLDTADFIDHFADAPDVSVVICYLEGLKDGDRFVDAVTKLRAAGKQVVVLKAGRSDAGQRSTLSHTGKLSTSGKVYDAIFRELGVIQAMGLSEVPYLAKLLLSRKPGHKFGRTVGVVSASGGICSVLADHADDVGLTLPTLSPATQAELSRHIPDFGSPQNPVDVSANVIGRGEILTGTLDVLKSNTEVSTWVLFGRPILDRYYRQIAEAAKDFSGNLVVSSGVAVTPETATSLREAGVPLLEDPELCMRAIGRLATQDETSEISAGPRSHLRRRLGRTTVVGKRIYDAMRAHDVPMPKSIFVTTVDEAGVWASSSEAIYPVAVKSASDAIPHKTEAGCVELGITSVEALSDAVVRVLANSRKAAPMAEPIIEIQAMVRATNELLVTITQDADFGAIAVIGLGGVATELLKDTAIVSFPASFDRVLAAMKSLKGWPLLAGYRGKPGIDLKALEQFWNAVSELYESESWIGELELNPVLAGPAGIGVVAVDALVTVAA